MPSVYTIEGAGLGGSRRRRAHKKACKYGVNKNTGACLKRPRAKRRRSRR
jgi:hypothetical protein